MKRNILGSRHSVAPIRATLTGRAASHRISSSVYFSTLWRSEVQPIWPTGHPHPGCQHCEGRPSCSVAMALRPSRDSGILRLRNGGKLASGPTRESSVCAWRSGLSRWPAMSAGQARSHNSKCSVIRATGGAVWLLSRSRPRFARLWPTTCCLSIGREMAMRRVSRWPIELGSLSTGGWLRFSSACLTAQCSGPGLAMLAPAAERGRSPH